MATETRTNNGIIGRKPNGNNLNTIALTARMLGKRTGVIRTDEICFATPRGFSAHDQTRKANDVACYIYGADISFKQSSFKREERIKNTDIFKIMSLLFYGM